MILDGPLLFDDRAPPCAHFAVLPQNAGARSFLSFVPSVAEPSEICRRFLFGLNSLFESDPMSHLASMDMGTHWHDRSYVSRALRTALEEEDRPEEVYQISKNSTNSAAGALSEDDDEGSRVTPSPPLRTRCSPHLYFVSCGNENFRGQSSVRVTLLVTRDTGSQAWADRPDSGCVPLDMDDNAILFRERIPVEDESEGSDSYVWHVASAIRWEAEIRKLRVTICVANGLPLELEWSAPRSELVVRVHWVRDHWC